MKTITCLFFISVLIASGCKSNKHAIASNASTTSTTQTVAKGNTLGKVSHQYSATGCTTVVIVKLEGQENPLTLIPKDKLASSFDVDGQEILFNYRTLKMPQPAGCNVGIPAELTEISKK